MENIKLMNMCKIIDEKNNMVLVQKRIKNWNGIAFPGGKIQNGESIVKSTIREIKEETGLEISNLQLCGIKNWYNKQKNERSIVFLFQTTSFMGDLITDMDEGQNFWTSENELLKSEIANNFDIMLKIYNDSYSEMIYDEEIADWNLY